MLLSLECDLNFLVNHFEVFEIASKCFCFSLLTFIRSLVPNQGCKTSRVARSRAVAFKNFP